MTCGRPRPYRRKVMAKTLGALLEQQASEITGRKSERAQLRRLLEPDGPVVAYVHGLAGVGKTTLLHAFAAEAREAGAAVFELDGHVVAATQREFLAALGGSTVEEAAAAVGAQGERVVLVVDTFELLAMIDYWLCRTMIPALPANVRVVIGGRNAPFERWRSYGPLLCSVPLSNLSPEEADELLRRNGVDARTAPRINAVAHGHPLSLQLAAWTLRDRPGLAIEEIAAGTVGEELARLYLDGLDAATRRALNAAALTRRTTLSLLAAMLPDEPATEAFARLRELPFVELTAGGLLVHDTVREATAALLRAADPQEYWRLRAAAWSCLRAELRGAPRRELPRYTADLLYLIEEEGVRRAFFPAAAGEQLVRPARAADLPAMEALAGDEADVLRAWWAAVPDAFIVACKGTGAVAGFACLVEPGDVSPRLIDGDPLASRWRAHLRRDPIPRGQRALYLRWVVPLTDLAALSALLLDATRVYMEMRPELRRVYARAADLIGTDPSCAMTIGYLPLEGEPGTVCMDFGPASVDGWLAELGASQLLDGGEEGDPPGLTQLEAQVLAYLRAREGQAVERAALLRDVWGYEWTGGSNVVEVVVSSLRRKLDDGAGTIATVRGVGYRYGRASSTMLNGVSAARRT
jgi:DNA-binding winged helix-turn-helix (wHTH) protein